MELANTNSKMDGVKTELINTKTDLASKLDGKPYILSNCVGFKQKVIKPCSKWQLQRRN
jgi:hypothetical protein